MLLLPLPVSAQAINKKTASVDTALLFLDLKSETTQTKGLFSMVQWIEQWLLPVQALNLYRLQRFLKVYCA